MDDENKKKWFERITAGVIDWALVPSNISRTSNRVEVLSGGPKWRYMPHPQQLRNEGFTDEEIEERCGPQPKS
jgi:hypothetical protein